MRQGKEAYSYAMSKCEPPTYFVKFQERSKNFWAVIFRREFKEEFNESYKTFCRTGKIVLRGEELTPMENV